MNEVQNRFFDPDSSPGNIWSQISCELWQFDQRTSASEDGKDTSAAPQPDKQSPADAKEMPPPTKTTEAPIPLTIDELILGTTKDGKPTTDYSIGAENYDQREAAQRALETAGVKALPLIDRILTPRTGEKINETELAARQNPEVCRRLREARNAIVCDLPRLMRDLASPDTAISNAAELELRRLPTEKLLSLLSMNRSMLTDEQFKFLGDIVKNQIPNDRLEEALLDLYGAPNSSWRSSNPSETTLRRNLVVHDILAMDLAPARAQLAYILIKLGGERNLNEAKQLLDKVDDRKAIPVDTANCFTVSRALLDFRTGKTSEAMNALENAVKAIDPKKDEDELYLRAKPLIKIVDDVDAMVASGTIKLEANDIARLKAMAAKLAPLRNPLRGLHK